MATNQRPTDTETGSDSETDLDRAAGDARLLASYLAGRDVHCTSCGYNLRGVTCGDCPECGRAITITLGRADRSTLPWFCAFFLYALATGVFGFFTLILVIHVLIDGNRNMKLEGSIVTACLFALSASVLIGILIRKRHHFWSWRKSRQWMVVASVLILPLLLMVGMATALAIVG